MQDHYERDNAERKHRRKTHDAKLSTACGKLADPRLNKISASTFAEQHHNKSQGEHQGGAASRGTPF
jgi:hypothetical protein